jgi:tRNA threonylcarbamoyl adenosine modification protein YjeE
MARVAKSERIIPVGSKKAMRDFICGLSLSNRQILLMRGEVGMGKTQCVTWLAEHLGAHDAASPSFALHNIYAIGGDRSVIDHFDLYRLKDGDDLESIGFWDVFEKKDGLVVIEWPERLSLDELPPHWDLTEIEIFEAEGESRKFFLRKY